MSQHNISPFFLDDNGMIKQNCSNGELGKIRWAYTFYSFDEIGELVFYDKGKSYSAIIAHIAVSHRKGTYQEYYFSNRNLSREAFFERMRMDFPGVFE